MPDFAINRRTSNQAQVSDSLSPPPAPKCFPKTSEKRVMFSTLINRRKGTRHYRLPNKMWCLREGDPSSCIWQSQPGPCALSCALQPPSRPWDSSARRSCAGAAARTAPGLLTPNRLGPAAAENTNFLTQTCFSSEQLASSFASAISPFLLIFFIFIFHLKSFFFCAYRFFSGLFIDFHVPLSSFHVWLFCERPLSPMSLFV